MIQFILGSAVALPLYHIFNRYIARQTNKRHINEDLNYVRSGDNNVNFLSDIISRLWSNLRVAVSARIRKTIEPILEEMGLPLKLVKVDLGVTPLRFENIVVRELQKSSDEAGYFKMNMDMVWNSTCDIQLKGDHLIPKFGIANITFSGRMQFVFNPLSDVMPCIGGIQIAFVDPPDIHLDFTGIAAFANSHLITDIIDEALNSTLEKMMVLPNRMLYKMDPTCDYLKMHLPPLGIARITARNGWGFKVQKGTFKDDVVDVYLKISLGNRTCQTKTIKNNLSPTWDESMDFLLSSHDQKVTIEAWDEDDHVLDVDDFLGSTVLTAGNFLLSSGSGYAKIPLQIENKDCGNHVALNCQLCPLSSKLKSYQMPPSDHDKNHLGGLVTIIVVRAINLPVPKEEAASCVKITYGRTKLATGVVAYVPEYDGLAGYDPLNPDYDATFQIPLNYEHMQLDRTSRIKLELVNGKKVIGTLELSHADLMAAPNTTISETRVIGGGASLQFCVAITGFESGTLQEKASFVHSRNTGTPDINHETSQHSTYVNLNIKENNQQQQVRVTVLSGNGFEPIQKTFKTDIPDVYCKVKYGSNPKLWQTSTIRNSFTPVWNEFKEYELFHHNQVLNVEVYDANKRSSDELLGSFHVTVEQVLLQGGILEIELTMEAKPIGTFIKVQCDQISVTKTRLDS
mmetsp:Transcript_60967/g.73294  ORF Transcript_60967/g.73294 Transcript_60967/m.73294 type:complete len:684 (-) Transcript_60967:80-2131(-)